MVFLKHTPTYINVETEYVVTTQGGRELTFQSRGIYIFSSPLMRIEPTTFHENYEKCTDKILKNVTYNIIIT